ncbi:hypothetical protein F4810DRAFT_684590 [Camillea tinctor]|nr:hypothetical protein F4810DRAFT_684590 [Camillea tinctor]
MLIYEKGSDCKSYVVTEQVPGMFGTLVINLPSPHTGGEFVVDCDHMTKRFRTSDYEMSYLAWYSDTLYELLPVKTGYRWVLTYNLVRSTANNKLEPLPYGFVEHDRELRKILMSWAEEVRTKRRAGTPLYYVLYHTYPEADPSPDILKLSDRARLKLLEKICSELRFDLLLVTLERVIRHTTIKEKRHHNISKKRKYNRYHCSWDGSDSDFEDYHSDHESDYIVDDFIEDTYSAILPRDLKGREIDFSTQINDEDILQENSFDYGFNDNMHVKHMKDVGSLGPVKTDSYRLPALMIIPPGEAFSYFTRNVRVDPKPLSGTSFNSIMEYFLNRCIDSPGDDRCLTDLQRFTNQVSLWPSLLFDEDTSQKALQFFINMPGFFRLIVARSALPGILGFFSWLRAEYDGSNVSLETLDQAFFAALNSQRNPGPRYQAIIAFIGDNETPTELESIISRAVDETLERSKFADLCDADGPALFDLLLYHKGFDYLQATAMTITENLSRKMGFMLGFLKRLSQGIRRSQVPRGAAESIYDHLAMLTISQIKYHSLKALKFPEAKKGKVSHVAVAIADTDYVAYDSFFEFICSLFQFKLAKHMDMFLSNLSAQAILIQDESFHSIWLPLLVDLIPVLEKYNANLSAPGWQQLYNSVLSAYLYNYVKIKPVNQPRIQRRVFCRKDCKDCRILNAFLGNDAETVAEFPVNRQRRHHIHSQLDSIRSGCTHETARDTIPETLVVVKRNTAQFAERKWHEREIKALENLAVFNQEKLRVLLGNSYQCITDLSMLNIDRPTHASLSVVYVPQPAAYSRPPPPINPEQELSRVEAEIRRLAGPSTVSITQPSPSQPLPPALPFAQAIAAIAPWQAPTQPPLPPPSSHIQPQPTFFPPPGQRQPGVPIRWTAPVHYGPVPPAPPAWSGAAFPIPSGGPLPYQINAPPEPPVTLAPIALNQLSAPVAPAPAPATESLATSSSSSGSLASNVRRERDRFSKPSYMMPEFVTSLKRKEIDVIDLTGDDG